MRVLVVDDSAAFRSQIKLALNGVQGIEVVGSASNGKIGLKMLSQKAVDVVILDLNMPEMGGLEFLAELKARAVPVKVIVFASRTQRSAKDTIEALGLGATDFVLKPEAESFSLDAASERIAEELKPKLHGLLSAFPPAAPKESKGASAIDGFKPSAIVIASSTGGPSALEVLFSKLTPPLEIPIFIAQHMPEMFTRFLAKRLADLSGVPCQEAANGEAVQAGTAYIAPGDFHLEVTRNGLDVRMTIHQGPKVNHVRPAADLLFHSAATAFGKELMGFVLTGMGEDGCRGAQDVKAHGGKIMIQDSQTSAVWGMPGAVYKANAFDAQASIQECARVLASMCSSSNKRENRAV